MKPSKSVDRTRRFGTPRSTHSQRNLLVSARRSARGTRTRSRDFRPHRLTARRAGWLAMGAPDDDRASKDAARAQFHRDLAESQWTALAAALDAAPSAPLGTSTHRSTVKSFVARWGARPAPLLSSGATARSWRLREERPTRWRGASTPPCSPNPAARSGCATPCVSSPSGATADATSRTHPRVGRRRRRRPRRDAKSIARVVAPSGRLRRGPVQTPPRASHPRATPRRRTPIRRVGGGRVQTRGRAQERRTPRVRWVGLRRVVGEAKTRVLHALRRRHAVRPGRRGSMMVR